MVARLSQTESTVSTLEEALVAERRRAEASRSSHAVAVAATSQLTAERDELKAAVEVLRARLHNAAQEHRRELTAMRDRSQYLPTVEVRRMQEELRQEHHQQTFGPLLSALHALQVASEACETGQVVGRSAMMAAVSELERCLAHTEASMVALREFFVMHEAEVEAGLVAYVRRVTEENKQLYGDLTEMKRVCSEQEAALSGMLPADDAISLQQYREDIAIQASQHQSRLQKAQELIHNQTLLIRQHEEAMEEMVGHHERLTHTLETLKTADMHHVTAQQEAARHIEELTAQLEDDRRVAKGREEALTQQLTFELTTVKASAETALRAAEEQHHAEHHESLRQLRESHELRVREVQRELQQSRTALEEANHTADLASRQRDHLATELERVSQSGSTAHANVRRLQEEIASLTARLQEQELEATAEKARFSRLEATLASEREVEAQEQEALRAALSEKTAEWQAAEETACRLQASLSTTEIALRKAEAASGSRGGSEAAHTALVQENARLQSAWKQHQDETSTARRLEQLQLSEATRERDELKRQLTALQAHLTHLPQLQAELARLKQEVAASHGRVEALGRERDGLNARLQQLLSCQLSQTAMDSELEQLMREAGDVKRKLSSGSLSHRQPPAVSSSPRATTTSTTATCLSPLSRREGNGLGKEEPKATAGGGGYQPPLVTTRAAEQREDESELSLEDRRRPWKV